MLLPKPRGELSAALIDVLAASCPPTPMRSSLAEALATAAKNFVDESLDDPAADSAADSLDDATLALWICYELHYAGFEDVDERAEWDPDILRIRSLLEHDLESRLRSRYDGTPATSGRVGDALLEAIDAHRGASLASFVHRDASRDQVIELLQQRSVYHLKEADPTTWVIPRLPYESKAALAALQYDEYGGGDPTRLHHHLFASGMAESGLRSEYGAYLDEACTEVLEMNNALSMFGLHRRLRAAALGHLVAFEATSSQPSRRMAQGLRRLGFAASMSDYYEEHVEADAAHEQIAARSICEPLIAAEPHLVDDLFFGVFTCLDLEDRFARRTLARWQVAA